MNKVHEQFERVRRWYKQLEEISNSREHTRESDYYQDILYAFFQNCWHLKDWCINSNSLDEKSIYKFIGSNKDLQLCRDLANGSKHLIIKNPSVSSDVGINRREYSISMGGGPTMISVIYWIEGAPGVDAFSLASNCLAQWQVFLQRQGIIE